MYLRLPIILILIILTLAGISQQYGINVVVNENARRCDGPMCRWANNETEHYIRKRAILSWFNRPKQQPKQEHTMPAETADLLVGYHGSCSMYQRSLERELTTPPSGPRNGGELGLGRFYVASHHGIARGYAKYTCAQTSFVRKQTPIICSIYIDSSKLPYFRKTYIPRYVHYNKNLLEMWADEEYMNEWERIISSESGDDNIPSTRTIRFAKFRPHIWQQFSRSYIGLQSAWPKEALKYMVAKCRPSFDYTEVDKPVDYSRILIQSQRDAANPLWGRILGSSTFSPRSRLDPAAEI